MSSSAMRLSVITQDALRGHGLECVEEVAGDLTCAVCLYPAFKGVLTACDHAFHQDCLHQEGTFLTSCPSCRGVIDDTASLKPLGRLISNLLGKHVVYCPQDCHCEVPFEGLERHITDDCPNTPFVCSNDGCEHDVMIRQDFAKHAETCEHRIVTCACGERLKEKDLKSHQVAVCPWELVTCQYCSQDGIARADMNTHLRTDCKAPATIALMNSLQDKINALTEENGRLKHWLQRPCGQVLTYRLDLPTCIRDLPLGQHKKCFEKEFTQNWSIIIYPEGIEQGVAGNVSIFIKSRRACRASFCIECGKFTTSDEQTFARDDNWGRRTFGRIDDLAYVSSLKVTIVEKEVIVKLDA